MDVAGGGDAGVGGGGAAVGDRVFCDACRYCCGAGEFDAVEASSALCCLKVEVVYNVFPSAAIGYRQRLVGLRIHIADIVVGVRPS